jgi:hypothetical protein
LTCPSGEDTSFTLSHTHKDSVAMGYQHEAIQAELKTAYESISDSLEEAIRFLYNEEVELFASGCGKTVYEGHRSLQRGVQALHVDLANQMSTVRRSEPDDD